MNRKPGILLIFRMIIVLMLLIVLLPFLSIMTVLLVLISFGKLRNFLVRWVGFILGRTVLALAGVRLNIRYHGKKPDQPAVFLFNHSSTLDMFIVISLVQVPTRFIAKREFHYNPFFWLLNKFLGNIMIDREKSRASVKKMHKAYDYLRKNRISLVFAPEGTRSQTGEIGPFKSGAFRTAMELEYPIIPVYIEGAYELCPGKSLVTRPGVVTIHIHSPIDTSVWDRKQIRSHVREVRNMYLDWSGQQ